jgi:hypothetical protein
MSGAVFDHEAERRRPLETRVVAALFVASLTLGAAIWLTASSRIVTAADRSVGDTPRRPPEIAELLQAASSGKLEVVESLIERGVDVNAPSTSATLS